MVFFGFFEGFQLQNVLVVFLFFMKYSYLTPWYLLMAKITKSLLMKELLLAILCLLNGNLASAKSKHFRPKLVHWNESVYCTPIDRALKMRFNEGWGSFLQPGVMKVFVKSIAPFFGQNKYTNIRRFSTIFRHKIRIFSLEKVQKNTVLSKMAKQHIFN